MLTEVNACGAVRAVAPAMASRIVSCGAPKLSIRAVERLSAGRAAEPDPPSNGVGPGRCCVTRWV